MSITSGFKKFKNHIKNGDGSYSLQSLWTSAQTVECADGTTVEDKIGGLKGISTDLETTETGYAADMTVVSQLNTDIAGLQTSFSGARVDLISALATKRVIVSEDTTFDKCIAQIHNINISKCKFGSTSVPSNINTGWTISGIGFKPNLIGIIAWVRCV